MELSNSQYKRFLTQGQNLKITDSSTMKNVSYISYSSKKWRQNAKVL